MCRGTTRSSSKRSSRSATNREDRRVRGALPDTPTIAESGYPGFEILSWYGLLEPAGTPAAVIERVQHEVAAILLQSEVGDAFAAKGLQPAGNTPAQFRAELSELIALWRPFVKAAGIAPK